MKLRRKRIIVAALASFAALVFVGTALAMPTLDSGGSTSTIAVRPDDRAGPRGVVAHAQLSQALSPRPFGRGERSFGASEFAGVQAASSGSDYDWSKTIGISAAAVALALALSGLGVAAMRQRKVRLGV
jgi:hypothetical protein